MNLIGKTGFVIFQGHNSIWSKQTLEKIGPWLEEHKGEPMIVEDVAASMRCYFKGFYGKSIWIDSGDQVWIYHGIVIYPNLVAFVQVPVEHLFLYV